MNVSEKKTIINKLSSLIRPKGFDRQLFKQVRKIYEGEQNLKTTAKTFLKKDHVTGEYIGHRQKKFLNYLADSTPKSNGPLFSQPKGSILNDIEPALPRKSKITND